MIKRSWLEISRGSIKHNISCIRDIVNSNIEINAVIKANAYGLGYKEYSKVLYDYGIRFFSVATLVEAIELRKLYSDINILILGYTPYENINLVCKYDLIQTVVSNDYLYCLHNYCKDKVRIHLAFDTGMSRNGIRYDDDNIKELVGFAKDYYLLEGVYTHLSVADSISKCDKEFTTNQIQRFKNVVNLYCQGIKYIHYENSSAILSKLSDFDNLVRPGLILYGILPNRDLVTDVSLKPVFEWKSVLTSIRTIHKGESVGYGNTYVATSDTVVGTICTGYADGYNRILSNKGKVLIHNQYVNIIGNVCMDQFMINLNDIKNCNIGDEVTLISNDINSEISIYNISKECNTITYEVLCNISSRVSRKYIK